MISLVGVVGILLSLAGVVAGLRRFCHNTVLVGVAGLFFIRVGVFGLRSCLLKVAMLA